MAARRPASSAINARPIAIAKFLGALAATMAVFYLLGHLGRGGTAAIKFEPAEYARATPAAASQSDAGTARQSLAPASAAASLSKDDKISKTPTVPAPTRSIAAVRDPTLDSWFVSSYLRCWSPPTNLPAGEKYGAQIRVVHKADGSLAAAPILVNPPLDPEWRPYADSAVRAVTKCNPLRVPPQYVAQFDQWKKMTLHF
jgi:predicted lipid-binding transport protein (Tim44 family)